MRSEDDLKEAYKEIETLKNKLDEKATIPRTRLAEVVTIKTISEIIPDMKIYETIMTLADKKFRMLIEIDTECFDSDYSGKTVEIKEETEDSLILVVESWHAPLNVKKEWVKNRRMKTFKVKVDISQEMKQLENLKVKIKNLKEKIEIEKIEEAKEKEIERQQQEKWTKDYYGWAQKVEACARWARRNIDDPLERDDYIQEELNRYQRYTGMYEIESE